MAPRIDAHQHFWRYHPETHPWIDDSMQQLRRDFLPRDLQPLLSDAGITGCVAVQAQQNVSETEWLLRLAAAHPFIRGVVGWVDLCAPGVVGELQRLAANSRLRGVRHIVQDEPDQRFLLRPDFMRGLAALAPSGLTYDILIYPRQLPAAIELVERFPQQRFVLDHLAKPAIREQHIDAWRQAIQSLGRFPNVCCKLSGMVTEARWNGWTPADFIPYLDVALACFGADRLMFGSDWPVCTLAASYDEVLGIITDYVGRMSVAERDAIFGGTAARFYGLSRASQATVRGSTPG